MNHYEEKILELIKVYSNRKLIAIHDMNAAKNRLNYGFENGYSNETMVLIANEYEQLKIQAFLYTEFHEKLTKLLTEES